MNHHAWYVWFLVRGIARLLMAQRVLILWEELFKLVAERLRAHNLLGTPATVEGPIQIQFKLGL